MQKLTLILLVAALGTASQALAATYSTEATMSLQKDEGTYLVEVKVSELTEQNGKLTERVISRPRLLSSPGIPATLYSGTQPRDPDYANEENVSVEVSWPYPNESGTASCIVTVKRGDNIVSKSKMQLKIDGPGRTPLVLSTPEFKPTSVEVNKLHERYYVLLELAGKTKQQVKKLAVENYGNKVEVRDVQGRLTDAGLSFGTYHDTGLTLEFQNEAEADRIASIFRSEVSR